MKTGFDQRRQKVNTQINIHVGEEYDEELFNLELLINNTMSEFGDKADLPKKFISLRLQKVDISKPLPIDEFVEESKVAEEFRSEIPGSDGFCGFGKSEA